MAKTSKQIQGDIFNLVKDSTLYSMISGEVYRNGYRPRDSKKEDAVVTFITGTADQIQTGIVTVLLYVPDINPFENGIYVEDGLRTEEMERLAMAWVDSLSTDISCYKFKLQQTIYTGEENEIHQHYIVIKLHYEYFGDDYAPLQIPQEAFIDATDTDGDHGYLPLLETEEGDFPIITPVIKNNH